MDPEGIRKCMSLGYSSKKASTTIGQCNFLHLFLSCWPSLFVGGLWKYFKYIPCVLVAVVLVIYLSLFYVVIQF